MHDNSVLNAWQLAAIAVVAVRDRLAYPSRVAGRGDDA